MGGMRLLRRQIHVDEPKWLPGPAGRCLFTYGFLAIS
jgi:hypothetical protein